MSQQANSDLDSIGKHCSLESCNRLDFLPIKCDLCGLTFCKEHSSFTGHNCPKYAEKAAKSDTAECVPLKPLEIYECSFEGCKQKEMVQVVCEMCHKNHCMKHRLQMDHKCDALKSLSKTDDETATKPKKEEFKFELKENVSEKNAPLAAKLALMKLRQTAVGPTGLPEQSKYYCFVQQDNSQSAKKPFFFFIKWPIGKCIEFLFEKLNMNKSNLLQYKLFLNEKLVESSYTVEELIKNKTFENPGVVLCLKCI